MVLDESLRILEMRRVRYGMLVFLFLAVRF